VAIAIDNRSVRREAVLPKSGSLETAKPKVDPDDATKEHDKSTLGIREGSKWTKESAEKTPCAELGKLVKSLVDGIGQRILSIQKAECDKQIQREITSEEDKELGILRSEFVHQVEDLSRKRSRSYVHHSLGYRPIE
jgi:hypothetical protein